MASVLPLGGRGHYIVWKAFISHAIINTAKWSDVDAVSTTASGQAYTLTLQMLAELSVESKNHLMEYGGEVFDPIKKFSTIWCLASLSY